MADQIQEGVHFRSGEKPPPFLRLVFLDFTPGTEQWQAREALQEVWSLLGELKEGRLRDLRAERPEDPDYRFPYADFSVVLGYGRRLFDDTVHNPVIVDPGRRPFELGTYLRGGSQKPFKSLHWHANGDPESAQSDVCLQLTAAKELTANRPIVELGKLIEDRRLPLEIKAFFSGFQRDDHRSWIDFHDGINNMPSSRRLDAIEAPGFDHPWMAGGTFMAFLKIALDLTVWRAHSRVEQEVLVGRDKLTGCPIERAEAVDGRLETVNLGGCPMTGHLTEDLPPGFRDPSKSVDRLVQSSHIHRSNLNRGAPVQDANNRVFRQGYEFLESVPGGGIRQGLNFVSFQRRLTALRRILSLATWMGGVNFGGPKPQLSGDPQAPLLMSLLAGGFYAVPPRSVPFPGEEIFY